MKTFMYLVLAWVVLYLLAAFVVMDLNPRFWSVEGRTYLVMAFTIICFIIFLEKALSRER